MVYITLLNLVLLAPAKGRGGTPLPVPPALAKVYPCPTSQEIPKIRKTPPVPTRKYHKPQASGKGKRARAQAMAGNRFAKVAKATKVKTNFKAGQAKRKPAKK